MSHHAESGCNIGKIQETSCDRDLCQFIHEHHSFYPRENVYYVTTFAPRLKAHRGTTPETLEELQDDEDAASASRYRK